MKNKENVKISSKITSLNPYLDGNGIIIVGGRLEKPDINNDCKHPVLMPKGCHISKLIILWLNNWLIVLWEQLMSELPSDRLQESPPFTCSGVNLFSPFTIRNYRKALDRYGVMFTCLCSRAIPIEIAYSLETDSFILSLRRFIGRRGNIQLMRSDNGTNFVGAAKELQKAFQEMDHNQISQYLQRHGNDWLTSIRNPPTASLMRGVWKRQIRTARSILNALLKTHG